MYVCAVLPVMANKLHHNVNACSALCLH